ncbi:MAG: M15 family metallopeptidase [Clostridia bacterium]|nr:M15 family metallopeptidase [Clostridia bacterium]
MLSDKPDKAEENSDKEITEKADEEKKSENDNATEEQPPQEDAEVIIEEKPEEPDEASVDTSAWNLVLANPWNKLPEDFTVELSDIGGGHMVDSRIVDDLNQMMSDLARAGHSAFICSSFRTNTKQTTLYNNEVNEYLAMGYSEEEAAVEAGKWVAVPGTSEHQTGLAVDIMSNYYLKLDKGQEDTEEQKWLMENSWKYGFVLRYPNDKSHITGIYYEPWHYRYVGKDAAKEMFERDVCFEEYLLG